MSTTFDCELTNPEDIVVFSDDNCLRRRIERERRSIEREERRRHKRRERCGI